MTTNWAEIIKRCEGANVDLSERLQVHRGTIWRWKAGLAKPSGDLAVQLFSIAQELQAPPVAHMRQELE